MNIISVKCPDCGSSMDVESDLSICYCKYCGHKIILQNDNDVRMREIEAHERIVLRSMEATERMAMRTSKPQEQSKEKPNFFSVVRYVVDGIVKIVIAIVAGMVILTLAAMIYNKIR